MAHFIVVPLAKQLPSKLQGGGIEKADIPQGFAPRPRCRRSSGAGRPWSRAGVGSLGAAGSGPAALPCARGSPLRYRSPRLAVEPRLTAHQPTAPRWSRAQEPRAPTASPARGLTDPRIPARSRCRAGGQHRHPPRANLPAPGLCPQHSSRSRCPACKRPCSTSDTASSSLWAPTAGFLGQNRHVKFITKLYMQLEQNLPDKQPNSSSAPSLTWSRAAAVWSQHRLVWAERTAG